MCLSRPFVTLFQSWPLWIQLGLITLFVFVPCVVVAFFAAQALNQAYYG